MSTNGSTEATLLNNVPRTANPLKTALITHLVDERREAADGTVANRNQLDESEPFKQLCEACRRGDVKTVQNLIAFEGVNVNGLDRFDYPPLTLASLCGHYEVVQLLLESGAVCERDTFQGERCLYNALNDRIRNLLLQYDYSKSSDPLQPWASNISALLAQNPLDTTDVTVMAGSSLREFRLHKFLLSARSPYFHRKLQAARNPADGATKPKIVKNVRLASSVDEKAFQTAIKFIYLSEITEVFSQDEVLQNIEKLSRQLELPELWELVLVATDPKQRRQKRREAVEHAQKEIQSFFEEYIIGRKVVIEDRNKADNIRIEQNNDSYADVVLRAEEEPPEPESDTVENGTKGEKETNGTELRKVVFYPVHKGMLSSEYFRIMFSSPFIEGQKLSSDEQALQIVPIDCSPEILELVLAFFYSEAVEVPLEFALDALFVADQLLIDRLKTKCAQVISTAGNTDDLPYSIYDVIRAGWMFHVQRLEEFGAKYIAERLEDYIADKHFSDLIAESAQRIKKREETDTIELVDDIRYYLNERFRLRMDDLDAEEMYDENATPDATAGEEDAPKVEEDDEEDFMREQTIRYNTLLEEIDGLLDNLKLEA